MTPSGEYRHAHYSDGPFFHPKDAICHNRDISGMDDVHSQYIRRLHVSGCGAPHRLDSDIRLGNLGIASSDPFKHY